MITVRVPASTSNLGAGFDCVGLALDLWLEARLVAGKGAPRYTGTLDKLRPDRDIIRSILGDALPSDLRLEVRSDIPVSRGLGASAAAAVAAIALRELIAGRPPEPNAVFREAAEREGHPDNAAPAVLGGLVLAASRPTRLPFHAALGVALALPERTVDTREARAILPTAVPRETAIAQAGRAAALVLGLVQGDGELIAHGMDDRLAVPHRKQLIPGYDAAVAAGLAAGAYGVTISGSGSALVAVALHERAATAAAAMAEALSAVGNAAAPLTPAVAQQGLTVASDRGGGPARKRRRAPKR